MRRVLVLLLCAGCVAGCGDRTPSDDEQIRSLLATFAQAAQQRDYQKLCDRVLAPKLLTGLEQIGLPCAIALRQSLGQVRDPRMVVGQVVVHGDRATAQVRTSAENQPPSSDTVQLQRVRGAWKVSALGGSAPAPKPGD
jgi:hypothetical protein